MLKGKTEKSQFRPVHLIFSEDESVSSRQLSRQSIWLNHKFQNDLSSTVRSCPKPNERRESKLQLNCKDRNFLNIEKMTKRKKKKKQSKDYIVIFEGILSTVILCSLGFLLHCYFILHKLRIIKTTLKLTFVYLNSCIQHHSITVYYYRWEGFTVQVNWSNRKPHWICV